MTQVQSVRLPLSKPAADLLAEAYDLQETIKAAMEQINKYQYRIDSIKEELIQQGVREGGNYLLEEKVRATRKVNVERFAARYPEEYTRLMEDELRRVKMSVGKVIRIQDAERLLGKDQLDPVCDLQSTITFYIAKKALDGTEHEGGA